MKFIKKYNTILKYIICAGISFLIDLILFIIFLCFFKSLLGAYSIIISTVFARIISSFINYRINRNNVFKVKDNKKIDSKSLVQFTTLVIIQMFVSSFSVFYIYKFTRYNEAIIKFFVECILFIINYVIQKKVIFKKRVNF